MANLPLIQEVNLICLYAMRLLTINLYFIMTRTSTSLRSHVGANSSITKRLERLSRYMIKKTGAWMAII